MRKNVFDEPEAKERKVKGVNAFDLLPEYIYCSLHCSKCQAILMQPVAIDTNEEPWGNQISALIQYKIAEHVCWQPEKPKEKKMYRLPPPKPTEPEPIGIDSNCLHTPFRRNMWVINITTGDLKQLITDEDLSSVVYPYLDGDRTIKPYL